MQDQSIDLKFRVITHGNNGIKSSQLFTQLQVPQKDDVYEANTFDFFQFDLDVNRRVPLFEPHNGMQTFSKESENVSAILVLISLTEIFSEGMHSLILRIPHNKFYGFNVKNENEWWKRVIVVFCFGEYEGGDGKIQQSIAGNGGIKEIVKKAGNRYIWVSNHTPIQQFENMLQREMQKFKENGKPCLTGCINKIDNHASSIIKFFIFSIIIVVVLLIASVISLVGIAVKKALQ